jgi:hypothetical protein
MPLCNLRSIIEILIPGDTGSWVADTLMYQVGFGSWLCIPLIVVLPFFFGGLWLMQKNVRLFLYIVIPLGVLNIWTQVNSKYGYNPLPYTVPVNKADPNQADSVAPNDYTADGKYVWQDDDSRLSPASWGTSYVVDFHTKAIPGQITQEEANYQLWLLVENADLIVNNVYSAKEYNNSVCYELRDYLRAREKKEQDLAPLHNGGFSDRIKYRWAIDTMNEQPSPIQKYIDARHNDEAKVQFELWGPIVFGGLACLILSYIGKKHVKARELVETNLGTSRWDSITRDFNRAKVIKTARRDAGYQIVQPKNGMAIDGPITLRYPKLFIYDTPFDLDRAEIDEQQPNIIHLRDGTQLSLYQGEAAPAYVQEPPVKKPTFTWEEPAPVDLADEPETMLPKPKFSLDELTKQEPQPPTVATSARRRSIFHQG